MGTVALIQDQVRQAHAFIDGTVAGVSEEQAHWLPPGAANPVGATFGHLVVGEDSTTAVWSGREPLFATTWRGRTGLSTLPPVRPAGAFPPLQPGWHDWAQQVRVDLAAARAYAHAVYAATDAYLATLSDADLARSIELSAGELQLGRQSLAWVLSAALTGHVYAHWGEIACLLGCQGEQGFPF